MRLFLGLVLYSTHALAEVPTQPPHLPGLPPVIDGVVGVTLCIGQNAACLARAAERNTFAGRVGAAAACHVQFGQCLAGVAARSAPPAPPMGSMPGYSMPPETQTSALDPEDVPPELFYSPDVPEPTR